MYRVFKFIYTLNDLGYYEMSDLVKKLNNFNYDLELNPTALEAFKGSRQERIYQELIRMHGAPPIYRLIKNQNTGYYKLIGPNGLSVPKNQIATIYPFVILEKDHGLELRLGLGNHFCVAEHSRWVKAAGDIHLLSSPQNGEKISDDNEVDILRVTDQSFSYHIRDTDPKIISQKKESAYAAIHAVGLPMDKFEPFKPKEAVKPKELIFSTRLHPKRNTDLAKRSMIEEFSNSRKYEIISPI